MKVVDFKGHYHNWPPKSQRPALDAERPRSELHVKVRELLTQLFPTYLILEEIRLPGTRLFADFVIPNLPLIVEGHGRQHYEYIEHFHKNVFGFAASRKRDNDKIIWCAMNKIPIVELCYKDTVDEWRSVIERQIS
jgi:hypothetical protein